MRFVMVSNRKRDAVRAAIVLALVAAALIATLPGHGRPRAEDRYGCDVVWAGSRSGVWDEAASWSTGRVPGASDRVCVPRGRTVAIMRGDWRAGSIEVGGSLQVTHGSLRLVDATATSELGGLTMAHAEVGVAGVLEIADEFYWGPGAHLFGPGHIDLGVASTSRMVGGEGATLPTLISNDDAAAHPGRAGTRAPKPLPCGPYSPLASQACGTRDRAALADARVTWARFAALLNSRAEPEQVAPLLLPGHWDAAGGGATTDLIEVARKTLRLARVNPRIPGALEPLLVVGDRAYGVAGGKGRIELQRAGDGWLVASY
jgi:hypothetical protein